MIDKTKELEDRVEVLEQALRETLLHLRNHNNSDYMWVRYDKVLGLLDGRYVNDES